MDSIDLRILNALQTHGRIKNASLARELGMAPSTVLERVRRLEKTHLVRGYRAVIDPKTVGLTIQAMIVISLERHDVKMIRKFETAIRKVRHVRACYHLSGRFDYLLHVAATDLEGLGNFTKTELASIPGIGKLETLLVLSVVKPDAGWPIEELVSEKQVEETPAKPPSA